MTWSEVLWLQRGEPGRGETVKEAQPLGSWSRRPSGLSRGLSPPGSGCRPRSPAPWPQLLLSQALTLPPAPGADGRLSLLTEMQKPVEAWPDLGDSQTGEPGRVEEKEMEMSKVPGVVREELGPRDGGPRPPNLGLCAPQCVQRPGGEMESDGNRKQHMDQSGYREVMGGRVLDEARETGSNHTGP